MKALGKMHNFAIPTYLFGELFYVEVRESAGDFLWLLLPYLLKVYTQITLAL